MKNLSFSLFLFWFVLSCESSKPEGEVCHFSQIHCSHIAGCIAYYSCYNSSINNMNLEKYSYDCVADRNLASFCKQEGYPCIERRCAPAPRYCRRDADCPELGTCDWSRSKCVEAAICRLEAEWMPGSTGLSLPCSQDGECNDGFLCDPVSGTCVPGYCGFQREGFPATSSCAEGYYCQMDPPVVDHFCGWFTDGPLGRCVPSTHCETAADCTDPRLPVCDDRGTCVPQ